MENLIKPLIIALFITIVSTLHLQSHQQETNSAQLNKIQQNIVSSMSSLRQNEQDYNKQLLLLANIDDKIKLTQSYLLKQRAILLQAYQYTNNNITTTSYTCPSTNSQDIQTLTSFNSNMQTDLTELNTSANSPNNNNTSISTQVENLLPILQSSSLPIALKSAQVEPSNYKVHNNTNINQGLFALGGTNLQDITAGYISEQNNGQYNIICPENDPFANEEGLCISCPPLTPYFLLDNHTCIVCRKYDEQARQCLNADGKVITKDIFFTNFGVGLNQVLLADGQSIDNYNNNPKGLEQCPSQRPFSKGSTCIACSQGLLFSLKDSSCQTCPQGKYHSTQSHKCQTQYYFSNLNSLQWQTTAKGIDDILESITIKRSNQSYTSCPLQKPFATDQGCINCQNGTHFSYDTLKCSTCTNVTKLDLNEHRCLKPGNLNFQTNPLNTTNLIYNGKSQNQWMNIYYQNIQKYSGIADCPQDTPNFDGLSCISCPHSHPYFNMQLMVCQICQGTTLYDQSQHECVNNSDNRPIQTPSWQKMAAIVFSK